MKKIVKAFAILAASALIGSSFMACSSDDDGGSPSKPAGAADGVVKLDGVEKADFAAAWAELGTTGDHIITLGKGTYTLETGKTFVYAGTGSVTIEGSTTTKFGADVMLVGNPNTASQNSRELFKLTGKGTLVIKNVSMENIYGKTEAGDVQAEVLASTNGKIVAYNSTFLSHQDTIRTEGKSWFYKCAIKGDVDFLWMERNGVVALYEDCEITAVGDRTTKAYFTAPRSNRGTKIGKGLVVLNSTLKVENGLATVSLFRSPWNGDGQYYNQAAFVGTTINGTVGETLVTNNSDGIGDNSVVGWKVDSAIATAYPSKGSNVGTLSDADKTAEYSNRGMILNKIITIDGSNTAYVIDEDDMWDVSSYNFEGIENNAATKTVNPVVSDFDATKATVKWDFSGLTFAGAKYDDNTDASDGKTGFNKKSGTMPGEVLKDTAGTYTVIMDVNASANGKLAANTNTDGSSKSQAQINANTVLTVPVTAGANVTVTATSSGTNLGINESIGTVGSGDITYEATETGAAVIYAYGGAYISKVTVENLDLTQFNTPELKKYLDGTATGETKAVVITSADMSVKTEKTISINSYVFASYGATAGSVSWNSSNTEAASIENGVVTGIAAGKTNVFATVDGITSNSIEITVEQGVAGAFTVSWLDNAEHCASPYAATNEDETIAAGSNAAPSAGTWAYNSTKLDPAYSTYGLTYTVTGSENGDSKEVVYVDFTVTAAAACTINTLNVAYGNHGTDKVMAYVQYKKGSGSFTLIADETTAGNKRKAKRSYDLTTKSISLAAGETVTFRVSFYGTGGITDTTKSPTIGTVSVEGKKN